MTIGTRTLIRFSALWACWLALEAALAVGFLLGRRLWTPAHLALSAALLLAAAVAMHLLMYRSRPQRVPVMMYHSVADRPGTYPDPQIIMSTELFERQLNWLQQRGYRSLFLAELQAGLQDPAGLPRRAVCLTFDDGLLDNWVNVFPLLKKYDAKATFFIPTDFISDGPPRPTLEDVWQARVAADELECVGHLHWSEVSALQESGLVDIQSHGCTHDTAFINDEIVDFHHPGDPYFWLSWQEHPECKSRWLTDPALVESSLGRPVYRHERSLVQPAWIEDMALRRACEIHVERNGGRAFFDRPDWRRELRRVVEHHRELNPCRGRLESDSEYRGRVLDELQRSRRLLQVRAGSSGDYLCWPGEQYSDRSLRLALDEAGYQAATCNHGENRAGHWNGQISRKIAQEVFRHDGRPGLDYLLFRVNVRALEGNHYSYLLEFPLNRYKDRILRRHYSVAGY